MGLGVSIGRKTRPERPRPDWPRPKTGPDRDQVGPKRQTEDRTETFRYHKHPEVNRLQLQHHQLPLSRNLCLFQMLLLLLVPLRASYSSLLYSIPSSNAAALLFIDSKSSIGVQKSNTAAAAFEKGTNFEKEEVDDAEAVGDSPLDAYGNKTSNGTDISLDSLVEGETKIQKAMDATVCKDVKMDDLESIESNAAAFEEGIEYRIDLNIMHEETLEAPILDLEEL
uniref:Uncharacterized protein n=1 Tax=Tanacetum cinerariifolium TaxID=118510 RepID=A0A6L2JRU3_TANCI|nr:hypothetical protein [Tanacetum cinerariifolium]